MKNNIISQISFYYYFFCREIVKMIFSLAMSISKKEHSHVVSRGKVIRFRLLNRANSIFRINCHIELNYSIQIRPLQHTKIIII